MIDIGAMPAGKELDILIAEKVMGLTHGVDFGEPCKVDPPAYSTDIRDAWKVAERMGISVGPLYCFTKPRNGSIVVEWVASASGMHSMTAATATLAICRAALAAVQE